MPSPAAAQRRRRSGPPGLTESELAELQVRIATGSFMLVEKLLHQAYKEMEATLFDEVVGRLRNELPELIDQVLREHFEERHRGRLSDSSEASPTGRTARSRQGLSARRHRAALVRALGSSRLLRASPAAARRTAS